VRNQVAASIGGFFMTSTFERASKSISSEKNPDIQAQWIRALGNFPRVEAQKILIRLLGTDSYRNALADAAIAAIRTQEVPIYIKPLREVLQQHETNFTTRGFAAGLDALAYISRNEKDKSSTREFLLNYVNHKKKGIQLGAITALGTLEDPKAVAVLTTFASSVKESDERKAAEKALAIIRSADKPSDNLKNLRDEILDLKKEGREQRKELDALAKKLEGKTQNPATKATRFPKK
jgi:aminopeptidase N